MLAPGLSEPVWGADTFNAAYISEFVAENQRGLRDENRDHSGWIELGNGGTTTLNLNGWFLTDSPTNLTKWRFPPVGLLPGKFIVVFASGKNRTNDPAHLHANFRLSKQGGYLALVNPATNVVSEFSPAYPKQSTDASYGRTQGELTIQGTFPRPTPGRANASSGPGFAPEVIFSKPSGNFTESFTVALSTGATGAVIRYTVNGTLPTSSATIYSAPLLITNTAHLRARAYAEGLLPGPPQSAAYVKLSTNVASFTSTLPVLIMNTFGKSTAVSSRESFVHLSFHEPNNGKTSLTNPPSFTTRAGYRVRGSTSSGMPQPGFAVEFLDESNEENPHSALGLPADSDWILYAPNAYDPVMIHNPFIHQLSRDMGRYSPRTRFLEVYMVKSRGQVNDVHYHGIYVLQEKIKIARHRVNIERIGPEDLTPPNVSGGYLLKFDRVGDGESGLFAPDGRGLVYVEPREQTIQLPQRLAQRDYLKSFFSTFERVLNSPDWRDSTAGYRAYIDVEAAIDFHVLELLSGNVDALVLSTYFHKPRGGKIIFGPHWDFDRALGSIDERDAYPRQWNTGQFFGGAWWPRLFSDPDFWQLWVDRWQELRGTHFSSTNLNRLIDLLSAELREAQPREYQKWNLQPRGGSYQSEVEHMKDWLSNRIDFIDRQLVQPPRFTDSARRLSSELLLTLEAPTNTTVYYTLDGSDPRLPQGAISPNALIYTNSVPLKPSARVAARGYNIHQRQVGGPPLSTPWSRRVAASKELSAQ